MSNTCRSSSMWCCSDPLSTLARHPGASRDPVLLLFVFVLIASMATRAFALRASHFSLLVQRKVTKRKHPPAACPPRVPRCGFATDTGIFGRHIHVPSENAAHRARRPCTVLPASVAMPQGPRTSKRGSNSKARIKIKSTPPRSCPALRAREEIESNSNSGLHRVLEGLNNCRPLRGSREPVAGSRRAVLDFRLPATGYRFPLDIHKSNDEKEGFIQRCPGKNPFPTPHSPLPALLR